MATLNFSHVVSRKDQKDYLKNVEKELSDHKVFIEGEVKTLADLKSTFPSFKKVEAATGQEVNNRRSTFTAGRKRLED